MISKIKMEKGNTVEDESKYEENQKNFLESIIGGQSKTKTKMGVSKPKMNKFDLLGKRGGFGKDKVMSFN
jgi:hypothetical protein